jgi:hypothetical protein
MGRITVNVPDDVEEWLEAESDRLGWSKSKTGGECIKLIHSESKHITPNQSDAQDPTDVVERLEELEQRIEALEGPSSAPAPQSERTEVREANSEEPPASESSVTDDVRTILGDGPPRNRHARNGVVDAVTELAESGVLSTGELKERLYPAYEDHYSTEVTFWNSVDKHLKEVPGVHKPGYGEWAVDTDELRLAVSERNDPD